MNCLPAQKSSLPRQKNFPAPTLVEIRKFARTAAGLQHKAAQPLSR
jgi:hypothetical protein